VQLVVVEAHILNFHGLPSRKAGCQRITPRFKSMWGFSMPGAMSDYYSKIANQH
jgi:hypothetical protein